MRVTDEMMAAMRQTDPGLYAALTDAKLRTGLEAALTTIPQIKKLETTAEERAAWAAWAAAVEQRHRPVVIGELVRDIDRLAARLAAAEAEAEKEKAVEAEREACAAIADAYGSSDLNADIHNEPINVALGIETVARAIAAAIRSRKGGENG